MGGESCSIWPDEFPQLTSNATALVYLSRMLTEGIHIDIMINNADGNIGAHYATLVARSLVFCSMFSHHLKEKELSVIDISDTSIEACHTFLNYLY